MDEFNTFEYFWETTGKTIIFQMCVVLVFGLAVWVIFKDVF